MASPESNSQVAARWLTEARGRTRLRITLVCGASRCVRSCAGRISSEGSAGYVRLFGFHGYRIFLWILDVRGAATPLDLGMHVYSFISLCISVTMCKNRTSMNSSLLQERISSRRLHAGSHHQPISRRVS